MKRRVFLLAALAAAVALPGFAADKEESKVKPELKIVEVLNGATFTSDQKIDAEYQLVAEELGFKKATFQRDGGTLRIGVQLADSEKGKLFQIRQNSDCPDNTQFHVEGTPAITKRFDKDIKRTLVAWTKHRHDDFSAKLRVINISDLAGNKRNFDVQLDLSRVSRVFRE